MKQKRYDRKTILIAGDLVPSHIERDLPKIRKRFKRFEDTFDKIFPTGSSDRVRAVSLADLMETPLTLHLLGHNSAAIVELHGWLERFALRELSKRLGKNKVAREIIFDLIRRKTLSEVTDTIIHLGLWDQNDKAFITRLKNIRDGIVHKNFELLSKHIGADKSYLSFEMDKLINKIDCVGYFITTMGLIMKLVIRRRRKTAI
jgi:hypothetical protein